MSDAPALEQLQRWMLAVITHPRGVEDGIGSDAAQRELAVAPHAVESVIQRSAQCRSVERLAVYSQAYFARLMECLAAEFHMLAKAAGAEGFSQLCAGYLESCPSTSYTLGRLGAGFPQYLAETRPPRVADSVSPDWADLLIDLARLERTFAEVFDGPGEEGAAPIDAGHLRTLPSDEWNGLRLRITASLRFLTLQFPAQEYYVSLRNSASAVPPSPRTVTLAIYRRDYTVQRRELLPVQATLLRALHSELPLGTALDATAAEHRLDRAAFAAQLGDWFRDWTAAGIICGVESQGGSASRGCEAPG